MASSEVVDLIIAMVQDYFEYMLPIIGVLAGITFITSFLMYLTMGLGRRVFKG